MKDLPFHVVQAHDDLEGLAGIKNLPGIKHVYIDTPGWIDLSAGGEDGDDRWGGGGARPPTRCVPSSTSPIRSSCPSKPNR